ncbi:hypothetical protein CHS0354_007538 [Potamilus streckersoni]|uniref:Uncharacterized protein n=1 Tax=Potamilus streckersoni TaxID=2493646 RepID=A0AAE0VGN7_9BIVA|nr:hypothetical protein CHS0354_007538 [Potamilus streckersoni]
MTTKVGHLLWPLKYLPEAILRYSISGYVRRKPDLDLGRLVTPEMSRQCRNSRDTYCYNC